jgi:parvulin-like peptidyl-prolyl isomerase
VNPNNLIKHTLLTLSVLLSINNVAMAETTNQAGQKQESSVFATIGKEVITWQDFESEYKKTAKNKFFHGKPANDVVAELQRTISNKLVTDALILNEAKRRKLKPNKDDVNQEIAKSEQKFASDPQWKEAKARVLPMLTTRFQNESLVKKLEANVRQVAPPTEVQLQAYYKNHLDKFTSPAQQKVSLILLSVDPSSTSDIWQQTISDAKSLIKRAQDGENFAELAKLYSKDAATVDQGGDMGYLHEGMLPGLPQETINHLKAGEISEPIRLLEGVAIFRLTELVLPVLSSFESVKQRARELWQAEESDKAWSKLIVDLKAKTPMRIDESRFIALPAASSKD